MSKGTARRWSAFDDDVLRTLHANGRGVGYIATFMVCAKCTVYRAAARLGLDFRGRHRWTPAEDALLRKRYADEQTAGIARDLGLPVGRVYQRAHSLGLAKSAVFFASDLSARIRRGRQDPRMIASRFPKGHVPANKGLRRPGWAPGRMATTQFQKGRAATEARNYVPLGTERLSKDGYVERKVTDDPSLVPARRWKGVHIITWEAAHGPVPRGHCVAFIDGDKAHIALDNLECITHVERMRRNTIHRYPPALKQVIRLAGKLNRRIEAAHEKQD